MIQLDDIQASEIVDQQQLGMVCYVHRQTGDLITFPDPENFLIWKRMNGKTRLTKYSLLRTSIGK